jgi:hypothetical protein
MSLRLRSTFFMSAAGAATAALCFAIALAFPLTEAQPRPAGAHPPAGDIVNRTAKGDRLRVIVRPPDAEPFDVHLPDKSGPQLLDGCEAIVAPTDHSPAAKLPRSCVT